MRTMDEETQRNLTPQKALQILKEGNNRFVNNLKADRNHLQQINDTRDGQWPFAVILSCIDSRTPAELIFDQGLGDIFSVRVAGNVINDDVLGSLEYACKIAGSKMVVVLGHTKCGAIKGACDGVQMGHVSTLLNKIQPAIYGETTITEHRDSSNEAFLNAVTRLNMERSVKMILEQSAILREMIHAGEVGIIGAVYDVETGHVEFYEQV